MSHLSKYGRKRFGFTLIELMIVVSIIGILASIALPKFADLVRKSQEGATKGNLGSIRSAVSIYYSDMEGFNPCSNSLLINGCLANLTVNGKYLTNIPIAYAPYYHSSSSDDRDISNCSFAGVWGNSAFEDLNNAGKWIYCEGIADSFYGVVLVDCTHTDTKGTFWSNY